jgi:hypothetical protein
MEELPRVVNQVDLNRRQRHQRHYVCTVPAPELGAGALSQDAREH